VSVFKPKYKDRKTGATLVSEFYWCDFVYQRRRIRETTGQRGLTLAREYEKNRKREMERAVVGVEAAKPKDRIREVGLILKDWIKVRTAGKRPKTGAYVRERCAHLIEHFGSMLPGDLTAAAVADYTSLRESAGAAAASINREVYLLSRALKVNRDEAWPDLGRAKRKSAPVGRALSEGEVTALLDAARKNRSKYALPFIAAAAYTGFRSNEIRTMRWRQIDFVAGWIRSEASKTKAGEYREVPLLPELRVILHSHLVWIEAKLEAKALEDDFVFPFGNRGMPTDPARPCTNIASAWWTVRDAAGVQARLHDLRHTFVTRLLEAGNSEAIVRELIGHVDPQVMQRYTHVRRAAKREAIERAFGEVSKPHAKVSPKTRKTISKNQAPIPAAPAVETLLIQ
jgi:integrase